jgi:hypothetical protein
MPWRRPAQIWFPGLAGRTRTCTMARLDNLILNWRSTTAVHTPPPSLALPSASAFLRARPLSSCSLRLIPILTRPRKSFCPHPPTLTDIESKSHPAAVYCSTHSTNVPWACSHLLASRTPPTSLSQFLLINLILTLPSKLLRSRSSSSCFFVVISLS